ncbi:MAG: hypothetical protein ABW221_18925 [Vicinamibacteria bacterium]
MTALVDARGCLTDAGFAALAAARPGQAPAELAAHLAGCARCQDRVLQAATGTDAASRTRGAVRSSRRRWGALALVIGILLAAIVGLLATLAYVRG